VGIERITPSGRIGLVLGIVGIVLLVGFPAAPVTGAFILGASARCSVLPPRPWQQLCPPAPAGDRFAGTDDRGVLRCWAVDVAAALRCPGADIPAPVDFIYPVLLCGDV
jgi:hypothetical protein